MSPVERSTGHATRALVISFSAIALVVLLLWATSVWITNRHNSRTPTGTVGGVFTAGPADHLYDEIKSSGKPIFWPDVSGASRRPIYLSHTGTDATKGWHAFSAVVPGQDGTCVWRWSTTSHDFTASCNATRHLDVAGTGMKQFPVKVDKGKVKIDLTTVTS